MDAFVCLFEPECAFDLMGVRGSEHAIKNGWFYWPWNFDPTWLESCNGFEPDAPQHNET